jgi:uncharacterized protein (TIGR03382 family)
VHVIRSARAAGFAVGLLLLPGLVRPAGAGPADPEETVSGQVVSTRSHWARGRTSIVTESVLRTDDGREVTVRQLGGSVDGIRMVVLHGPAIARAGDRVSARVAVSRDLRGVVSRPVRTLSLLDGSGAIPFVRTEASRTRAQLAWESGCAQLYFDEAGTSHITGDGEFDEMKRVLSLWRNDVQGCSYFTVEFEGLIDSEVGFDGKNVVKFREERWCRPATDEDPEECYDAAAAGLTTLHFIDDPKSDRNGTLLDADVELNAINFRIAVDHESTAPLGLCESDLANTFTHEIGHLMGLDHTCWSGVGAQLTDDEGNPVPSCSLEPELSEEVREATMFSFQDCGETKKATPEPDDIAGVCAIYPTAADPDECRAADLDPGGCAAAGGGGPAWLAAAALALLALRRRSRRRAQGTSL